MRFYEGTVYSLSGAVSTSGCDYSFLDIPGKNTIYVHFGYDRFFEIGEKSRLLITTKNAKDEWNEKQVKIPAVVRNGRLEFDFPAYLKSQGIRYKLHKRYNFYDGCSTNCRLIVCKKAEICIFRSMYDCTGINVVFFTRDLKIGGKAVKKIEQYMIDSTDEAEAFLKENLEKKADLSFAKLGALLDSIKDVRKESSWFEITFADATRLWGSEINWTDGRDV